MPEKRYQVFVSSTYNDLKPARQQVIQALLELHCIPAGMELFSAADEDQWSYIKKVIDQCDYYLVIIAGRYGSTDDHGVSYTEKEYNYAIQTGKPVIAFLHEQPEDLAAKDTETDDTKRDRLHAFRKLAEKKLCKHWLTPEGLGAVVSRGVVNLREDHPATGWIRGDAVASTEATAEILQLRKRTDELEAALNDAANKPPADTENLAHGTDPFVFRFTCRLLRKFPDAPTAIEVQLTRTWDDLFAIIAQNLIHSKDLDDIRFTLTRVLNLHLALAVQKKLETLVPELHAERGSDCIGYYTPPSLHSDDLTTIIIQFRALGLLQPTDELQLTPYGNTVLTRLRAVPLHHPFRRV